jgi:cytochrome c biogenesis protein CcmG/thiol:disulfide interchange protein DsbE
MWKFAVPVTVFAVIAVFVASGLKLNPNYVPSALVGKPMPEFSLPSLKEPGRMVGSDDIRGGVALLNVWGEWCVACHQEHGFLMELSHSGRLPIYGLNYNDVRSKALGMLARLGDPFVASAFDDNGAVGIDWGVTGAPESFLIAPDGTVLHRHQGPLSPALWQRDFEPLIEKYCGENACPRPSASASAARATGGA